MPSKFTTPNSDQPVTEVAIRSTPMEDLYVILGSLQDGGLATLQILINPLMIWMWIGGGVLVLGAVVAWWPAAKR